jgi:hypothetical protein
LVINTPLREAGLPASIVTRRIYGVYAGGRRVYYTGMSEGHDVCAATYRAFFVRGTVRLESQLVDMDASRSSLGRLEEVECLVRRCLGTRGLGCV